MVKPTEMFSEPKVNEIIEETVSKDGSKLLEVLQRAAKNLEDTPQIVIDDPHVDLGIFGNFWLQKPKAIGLLPNNDRPSPVFNREDYVE